MQKYTHPAILVGRHLVGIAVVQAASLAASGLWSVMGWLAHTAVPAGLGAAVSGLLALFFTRSQAPQFMRNAAQAAWIAVGALVVDDWQGTPHETVVAGCVLSAAVAAMLWRPVRWITSSASAKDEAA